ncbi:uncharacterized protein ASCRUDRAFT_9669 [Ascoidea rubescens DSM 1968]|uniref:Uncharacterized protein n=1 Tax=Ascoidea rubescens DSM 1968 TaxID=1344418 RepID=A0A1D2VCS6_9ASCO|nr:hypothetical protein ASCRUDRAFT_9669 [Ascoidea rubescens DSM 1968]ODV59277.1 hypothetical protein ASCRUDRAFT_9669 [Ascoidea rubescens DSM 1968]
MNPLDDTSFYLLNPLFCDIYKNFYDAILKLSILSNNFNSYLSEKSSYFNQSNNNNSLCSDLLDLSQILNVDIDINFILNVNNNLSTNEIDTNNDIDNNNDNDNDIDNDNHIDENDNHIDENDNENENDNDNDNDNDNNNNNNYNNDIKCYIDANKILYNTLSTKIEIESPRFLHLTNNNDNESKILILQFEKIVSDLSNSLNILNDLKLKIDKNLNDFIIKDNNSNTNTTANANANANFSNNISNNIEIFHNQTNNKIFNQNINHLYYSLPFKNYLEFNIIYLPLKLFKSQILDYFLYIRDNISTNHESWKIVNFRLLYLTVYKIILFFEYSSNLIKKITLQSKSDNINIDVINNINNIKNINNIGNTRFIKFPDFNSLIKQYIIESEILKTNLLQIETISNNITQRPPYNLMNNIYSLCLAERKKNLYNNNDSNNNNIITKIDSNFNINNPLINTHNSNIIKQNVTNYTDDKYYNNFFGDFVSQFYQLQPIFEFIINILFNYQVRYLERIKKILLNSGLSFDNNDNIILNENENINELNNADIQNLSIIFCTISGNFKNSIAILRENMVKIEDSYYYSDYQTTNYQKFMTLKIIPLALLRSWIIFDNSYRYIISVSDTFEKISNSSPVDCNKPVLLPALNINYDLPTFDNSDQIPISQSTLPSNISIINNLAKLIHEFFYSLNFITPGVRHKLSELSYGKLEFLHCLSSLSHNINEKRNIPKIKASLDEVKTDIIRDFDDLVTLIETEDNISELSNFLILYPK